MKKLICFLLIVTLTFSLMLSMTPLAFADESFTADPEVAERIFGLGLMPHVSKANYSPKARPKTLTLHGSSMVMLTKRRTT